MDSQLKKGILEMCLLHLISKNDIYGYELIKIITKVFPDVLNSTIYTILRRLTAAGYVKTYIGSVSGGTPRKYYILTDAGIIKLNDYISNWLQLCDAVKSLGLM